MNKTVVACAALLACAVIISVYICSTGSRYVTANAGDGTIYRTDRKTGKTVPIEGSTESEVKPYAAAQPKPESLQDRAIKLAKLSHTLGKDSVLNNEEWLRVRMGRRTGALRVIGWEAKPIDDQICTGSA